MAQLGLSAWIGVPQNRPQIVGLLLQGQPQKDAPNLWKQPFDVAGFEAFDT